MADKQWVLALNTFARAAWEAFRNETDPDWEDLSALDQSTWRDVAVAVVVAFDNDKTHREAMKNTVFGSK